MRIFFKLFAIFALKAGFLWATDPVITVNLENITSEVSTFKRVPFLPSKIDFADDQNTVKAFTGELLCAHYKGYLNVPYLIYLACEGLFVESKESPMTFGCVGEYLKTATAASDTAIYDAFLKMYPHIQVTHMTPETIFATEVSYLQFVNIVATNFLPKLLQVMGADTTIVNATLTREPRHKIALRLFAIYGIIIENLEEDKKPRVANTSCCLLRYCCFFR